MNLIEKYLGEGLTGPTRMQLQKELDNNVKTGMSLGQARKDVEKRYKKRLTVNSKGIIVNLSEGKINEVSGYTLKPKDKKIILAFINGDKKGEGNALWIEGDYLYGPSQSTTSDYVAKRDKNGNITTGHAYGNVSQTWVNFIKKNTK